MAWDPLLPTRRPQRLFSGYGQHQDQSDQDGGSTDEADGMTKKGSSDGAGAASQALIFLSNAARALAICFT